MCERDPSYGARVQRNYLGGSPAREALLVWMATLASLGVLELVASGVPFLGQWIGALAVAAFLWVPQRMLERRVLDAADAGGCIASGQGGTDRVLSVPDQGSGLYELNSASPPAGQPPLTFEEGVTYTLIIQVPDGSDFDAYGARFQPGPPPHMVEFADKTQVKQISAGTSLTITRDDAPGADGRLLPAAVLVSQIDPQNPTGVPSIVWSSIQYNDPKTLALLALSDEPYRVGTFTVDGSAFVASGYYIVTLVSLAEGKASDNAFIGSTALAGSGDSGLVQVQ